jgi:hypothetical protein
VAGRRLARVEVIDRVIHDRSYLTNKMQGSNVEPFRLFSKDIMTSNFYINIAHGYRHA